MTDTPPLSFEQALSELELIVSQLESGQVPLADSLALYEKGAALKAICEQRLEQARLQIEKITLSRQGQVDGLEPATFD